jgi:uncharacterized membrane protein YtjA (UPF0391 family)
MSRGREVNRTAVEYSVQERKIVGAKCALTLLRHADSLVCAFEWGLPGGGKQNHAHQESNQQDRRNGKITASESAHRCTQNPRWIESPRHGKRSLARAAARCCELFPTRCSGYRRCPCSAGWRKISLAATFIVIGIDEGRFLMLHHAVILFIVALVTAILGFSGIAGGAAGFARILFFVFSMGTVVSVFFSATRRV